jgi:MFS superfamily sulfate permease-like transporter
MEENKKGILVVKVDESLSMETCDRIKSILEPLAEEQNIQIIIAPDGMDVEIHRDLSPVLEELKKQTKELTLIKEELYGQS